MNDLETCINFFDECLSFREKYRRFERACIRLDPDDFNDESIKEAAEYYVLVKHQLSELCHLKFPKIEANDSEDSEEDMDYDTSVSEVSNDTDDDTSVSEVSNDTDDDDNNEDEDSINDSDSNNMSTDAEDEEVDEDDEDDEDVEDDTILFRPEQCCFDKILEPFFDALKGNKLALATIQREEDKKEEQYERLENWFEPKEKCLTAKLLQEICQGFYDKQHKFFKLCSSMHIKMLASYCKNIVKAHTLEEMFGDNYKSLIDDNVSLHKKRKIFKDKENIDKLITYLKENTLPKVHEFIQARQQQFLQKCTRDK